jgi:ABC-2 type transport system permease protein
MLNMIKLDWLSMKCYWLRIIIVPIVITVYGVVGEFLIIPFISFMMLSFSVNPFAVEEKGKLDNLYLTLPITRKTIVNTRYALSLIMQFVGLLFGVIMTIFMSLILKGKEIFYVHNFNADVKAIALLVSVSLLLYSILNLSMFPTLFKIGYAKGKAIGFYIPIVAVSIAIFALYFLWYLNDNFQQSLIKAIEWSYNNPLLISGILVIASGVMLAISYKLSLLFYSKRDL